MTKRKSILFISHEASLTGAPILLLNLVKCVSQNGEYKIRILCIKDGALYNDFSAYGPTFVIKPENYNKEKNILSKLWNYILIIIRLMYATKPWLQSDIVFNNTSVNGKFLKFYSRFKKQRIFSYIHELENSITSAPVYNSALATVQLSEVIVSPNMHNQNVVRNIFNSMNKDYKILRYLIFPENNISQSEADNEKHKLINQYNIPPDAMMVLGMGTFDSRKGVDYFIKTANELKSDNIHFFWIGAHKEKEYSDEMMDLIDQNNIENFHFLGPKEHSLGNFAPFDILFLSSREDPYPVVVLEAAEMSIPTVCFAKSGGIVEFIGDDCGWQVTEFSEKMAAEVIKSITRDVIKSKGYAAKVKVENWHINDRQIYSDFKGIIEK